jgi:hypothetical protein
MKSPRISAQVILPPVQGKLDGSTRVTSETVQSLAPSPDHVARTRKAFEEAGFEVSKLYGISFSITGPLELFEDFFKTSIKQDESQGTYLVKDKTVTYELPLQNLPAHLREHLTTVTFSPPPDFGPTNF